MATFVSVAKNMNVWGEKLDDKGKNLGEKLASFAPFGSFTTEDEEIIEKLRAHGAFNKKGKRGFIEASAISKPKGNVIQGIRSAGTQPILGKDEKLIRLGGLRAKLFRLDGSWRLDATEEDKKELKELQEELGV